MKKTAIIFLFLLTMASANAAVVRSNRDPRVDQDLRTTASPEFVNLNLTGAFVDSPTSIGFRPSGDINDYLSWSTVLNTPRLTIIGGRVFQIISDAPSVSTTLHLLGDGRVGLNLHWDDISSEATISSDGDLIFTAQNSGVIRLQTAGDFDDYLQYSTVANVPTITAIGGSVIDFPGMNFTGIDEITANGYRFNSSGNAVITYDSIGGVAFFDTAIVNDGSSYTFFISDSFATLKFAMADFGTNEISDGQMNGDWDFNGGNFTEVGNITGTDLDISAGTGDYTSTGTLVITSTAANLERLRTAAITPINPAMFEIVTNAANPLNTGAFAGITSQVFTDVNNEDNPISAGAVIRILSEGTNIFNRVYVGIFGNADVTIDNSTPDSSFDGQTLTIQGLQFTAVNKGDYIPTVFEFIDATVTTTGAQLTNTLGFDGKEIGGTAIGVSHGVNIQSNIDGNYSTTNSTGGNMYGVKVTITDLLDDIANNQTIDSYGLHLTCPPDNTLGSGGTLKSVGVFNANDVDNMINGRLRVGDTTAPTNELEVNGVTDLGDGGTSTYMRTEQDADTFWVGAGTGLPYGHMFVDGTQSIIVALTLNTPAEVEDDGTTSAEDGWLEGDQNLITFPTGGTQHYISVTKPGVYHITWNLSFKMVTGAANTQIHAGLTINSTTFRADRCEAHRTISNNTDTGNMGGTCTIDLPNGTEQLSLWMENTTNNNDAEVFHGSLTAIMVGGT